ncbi:hypothetical protein EB796_003824 [Bugula neritina]|uniref:Uncharacterized protein n=1 Tax=Bugula neritina TaxID=10212 RepID=A0A7J7KI09_BUGNE|nr:hypothetical protein EB796_003824 [Bugula neritina]
MNRLLKTDSLELFSIIPENVPKPSALQDGESPIIAFTPNGVGEKIHIATVSSSTSDLTLYIADPSHINTPTAKKIAWGQSGYGKIQALTFGPLGDKLAVVCSRFLYILPFGTFMKPSPGKLSSAKKNVVEIKLPFFMSPVSLCSCIWWQTGLDRSIIIIGTEKGDVYFIDVENKKSVHKVQVHGHITRLELVPDDRQHITYLLISARSSLQWRLLLDVLDIDLHMTFSKEKMLELGYKFYGYGGMCFCKKYIKSILHTRSQPSDAECEFKPRRFTNIPISMSLRYQSAKGCHLISGVDKADLSLKIYDSSVEHHPLYVYNLPAWTEHLVYTDRLIFCAFPSKHVLVLANQLSEKDVNTQQQTGYVIHQFDLGEDESIKYMSAIKFPVTWHNELVETSSKQDCVSSKHTILDGCLLVTNRRMIQFTPEFSPEQLFLNWSTSQTIDVERLHLLAQVTHIDFLNLYLHSADFHLRKGNLEQALDCLHYSKCDDNSKVSLLYKYGEHELVVQTGRDILEHSLTQSTSCRTESATSNICNMVLSSFLAILEERTDDSAFHNEFREFLLYNRSYSLDQAMKLLCDKNHLSLLLEISLHRKFARSALEHMFSLGKITPSLLHAHVENSDFVSALGSVASGSIAYLLNTEDFCTYLLNTNSIETSNLLWLAPRLHELDYSSLRLLAQRYHPHSKFTQSSIKFFTEYVESVSAQSYARFHQVS